MARGQPGEEGGQSEEPPAAVHEGRRVPSEWPRAFRIRLDPASVDHPVSAEKLSALLTKALGLPKPLVDADLEHARRLINDLYETNGFINSRAVIYDQAILSNTVEITVLYGSLPDISVQADSPKAERYIERRIRSWNSPPLNIRRLADALETLRKNPGIKRLVAHLRPLRRPAEPGDPVAAKTKPETPADAEAPESVRVEEDLQRLGGVLDVRVQQANPWRLELVASNHRPASVGAEMLEVHAARRNLVAFSDSLELEYGLLERAEDGGVACSGLDNLGVSYAIPVTVWDTTIEGFYERKNYSVIEEPFNQLDIDSHYQGGGLRIRQPLPFLRNARNEITVGLDFQRRHSESFLLGEPFGFSPGTLGGESDVSALRMVGEWTRLQSRQALALRFMASFGLDFWGATAYPEGRDGQFISLLGQAQYLRILWSYPENPIFGEGRLLLRGAFQWADEPLVALEQFAIGGPFTVRGYRVNQLVRDRGVLVSAELPVTLAQTRNLKLTLGPFFDFGAGRDVRFQGSGPDDLASVGLGFTLAAWEKLHVRLDWGYPFRDFDTSNEDLQDCGLYFLVSYNVLRR